MPDHDPAPGEAGWSVWLNRHRGIAFVLIGVFVAAGVVFGVLRAAS